MGFQDCSYGFLGLEAGSVGLCSDVEVVSVLGVEIIDGFFRETYNLVPSSLESVVMLGVTQVNEVEALGTWLRSFKVADVFLKLILDLCLDSFFNKLTTWVRFSELNTGQLLVQLFNLFVLREPQCESGKLGRFRDLKVGLKGIASKDNIQLVKEIDFGTDVSKKQASSTNFPFAVLVIHNEEDACTGTDLDRGFITLEGTLVVVDLAKFGVTHQVFDAIADLILSLFGELFHFISCEVAVVFDGMLEKIIDMLEIVRRENYSFIMVKALNARIVDGIKIAAGNNADIVSKPVLVNMFTSSSLIVVWQSAFLLYNGDDNWCDLVYCSTLCRWDWDVGFMIGSYIASPKFLAGRILSVCLVHSSDSRSSNSGFDLLAEECVDLFCGMVARKDVNGTVYDSFSGTTVSYCMVGFLMGSLCREFREKSNVIFSWRLAKALFPRRLREICGEKRLVVVFVAGLINRRRSYKAPSEKRKQEMDAGGLLKVNKWTKSLLVQPNYSSELFGNIYHDVSFGAIKRFVCCLLVELARGIVNLFWVISYWGILGTWTEDLLCEFKIRKGSDCCELLSQLDITAELNINVVFWDTGISVHNLLADLKMITNPDYFNAFTGLHIRVDCLMLIVSGSFWCDLRDLVLIWVSANDAVSHEMTAKIGHVEQFGMRIRGGRLVIPLTLSQGQGTTIVIHGIGIMHELLGSFEKDRLVVYRGWVVGDYRDAKGIGPAFCIVWDANIRSARFIFDYLNGFNGRHHNTWHTAYLLF